MDREAVTVLRSQSAAVPVGDRSSYGLRACDNPQKSVCSCGGQKQCHRLDQADCRSNRKSCGYRTKTSRQKQLNQDRVLKPSDRISPDIGVSQSQELNVVNSADV
ncbi:hypothetical protein RRG08_004817 [Elysia crispata]|uniref:Uncharacterized protein n=1 Tax=Elysia crispata TaxID=231223 RepID=A0AAE0Y5L3_9GAST|nr:hypothetical protein RRG08_004817 [Elysia crispata]